VNRGIKDSFPKKNINMFKTDKPMKIKTSVTPTSPNTGIVARIVKSIKKLFA